VIPVIVGAGPCYYTKLPNLAKREGDWVPEANRCYAAPHLPAQLTSPGTGKVRPRNSLQLPRTQLISRGLVLMLANEAVTYRVPASPSICSVNFPAEVEAFTPEAAEAPLKESSLGGQVQIPGNQ